MPSDPVAAWLMRLCDPDGCRVMPARRLEPSGLMRLLQLADEHAVTGATLDNIRRIEAAHGRSRIVRESTCRDAAVVVTARAAARDRWFDRVAHALLIRQRTATIVREFADVGVRAGLVKGEDFANRLYAPASLRPFRDIDLIVPQEQMPTAAAVMEALGFREAGCGRHAGEYGERTWDGPDQPLVRVDLHWNLINSPTQRNHSSLPYEAFPWAPDTGHAGAGMLRTSPAGMLLVAAVHATLGHRFDRLQQLCDIRQICRGAAGPIDVEWLAEAAARHGVATAVAGALEVTARLLDDETTADVRRRVAGRRATTVPWRVLVNESTLLDATRPLTKLRRTIVREWMKRAA